jgi:hypothetical protein
MLLVLVAYAIVHSPIRSLVQDLIWPLFEAMDGELPGCRPPCDVAGLSDLVGAASAMWLIAASGIASWALLELSPLDRLERVVAWGALASAFATVPLAIVGGLGDLVEVALLRPPAGPVLASVPALIATGWAWRAGWRSHHLAVAKPDLPPLLILVAGLVVGVIVLAIGVAIRRPPGGFDELGYHAPLAALFFNEGTIAGFQARFDDTFALWHPGSGELWLGLLLLVGGEPLAIVGQLPYALLGAAGVTLFARRLGLRSWAALLAGLLFLLAPMVVIQSTRLSSDVIGAGLVIAAGALATAPAREWSLVRICLLGLLLGVIVATKVALLPMAVALALVAAWTVWRARREPALDGRVLRAVVAGTLLFLLAVGPWWLRNLAAQGNPIYPAALPFIGRGIDQTTLGPSMDLIMVPARLLWPLYPVFEAHDNNSGLGAAFAVAIVPALVGAVLVARRRPLAILAVMAIVTLPIWWQLSRHEPRFLIGLAGLAFGLLPFALIAVGRRWRHAATGVLALACLGSAAVTATTALSFEAGRPVGRDAYYTEAWNINPAVMAVPENEGVLLDDDCPGGLTRLYPLLGPSQTRHVARIGCEATTEEIVATMHREGLRYAYATGGSSEIIPTWERRYPEGTFELVAVTPPGLNGQPSRSRLYRLTGIEEAS